MKLNVFYWGSPTKIIFYNCIQTMYCIKSVRTLAFKENESMEAKKHRQLLDAPVRQCTSCGRFWKVCIRARKTKACFL